MYKLKIITLVLCVALSAGSAIAATSFSVEGYVYERATGEPIEGAHIYYQNGSSGGGALLQTDKNGFYRIEVDDRYGPPMKVQAIVVMGRPSPIFESKIGLPYPPEEGATYVRNLYIDIPKEYSGNVIYDILDAVSGERRDVKIIDDGDPGFTTINAWYPNTSGTGFQNDLHYTTKGTGSRVAKWTFQLNIAIYKVYATWVPGTNRATDAPYTLLNDRYVLDTVRVNQEIAPNDIQDQGAGWKLLGEYYVDQGTLNVELSNDADQYVIADAIRVEIVK